MDTMANRHSSSPFDAGRKVFCIKMEEGFCTPNLCLPKMLRLLLSIQICMTNMKHPLHPPPPTLTRPGNLMCHSPLGGVGGGRGVGSWGGSPRPVCPSLFNRRQSPSNRRRLLSNRWQLPSNRRRLPSNRQQRPSNRHQLPSKHRRLSSRGLPSPLPSPGQGTSCVTRHSLGGGGGYGHHR